MDKGLNDEEFIERLNARTVIFEEWQHNRKTAKEKLVSLGLTEAEAASIFDGPTTNLPA